MAYQSLPHRRLWMPAFVIRRFPVTNREYLGFLDALVLAGREEDALRCVPRERSGQADQQGALIYGRRPDGGFELRADAAGDQWLPEWPVCMVDWYGARAFAAWERERTGQAWRLPGELEWAKSARGVDGRTRPWGDGFDPSWCCMWESHSGRPLPAAVESYPIDESVYGVRGMAGNALDWCADGFHKAGPPVLPDGHIAPSGAGTEPVGERAERVCRGGSWGASPRSMRSAYRYRYAPIHRDDWLGFRLARSPAAPAQAPGTVERVHP